MSKSKRLLSLYMIITLVVVLLCPATTTDNAKAAQMGYICGSAVYIRETPAGTAIKDGSGNDIMLPYGQKLTIEDTSNGSWYKVTTNYGGQDITGYCSSTYIILNHEPGEGGAASDDEFENYMNAQGFPESYKPYLRNIHKAHPNWVFKAVLTGIDWNTLLKNECNRSGSVKNLVQGTSYAPHYGWRSTSVGYSYVNDKWTSFDGSTWFAASDALVTYYLDPRTYLYENYIFAFESLSYHSDVQTEAGVEAVLNGTFMSHTVPAGESKTYAQLIMDAAAATNVSPYHLASRIKQEQGASGTSAAFGNNSSYPGYYNFFNVGAVDSADGSALVKGLRYAATPGDYGRPWNSPSKAITGGASYLGRSFISVGQNTLYTQKFNVTNRNALFSHQYMTNVQAPSTECLNCYNAYRNNGMLDQAIVFEIPVYLNMPAAATSRPSDVGSPNNWLKSLDVSGYAMSPAFSMNYQTEFTVTVPAEVENITVSASPINGSARISGAGPYAINMGTNKLELAVTAQNGDIRIYNITIVRGDAAAGTTYLNGSAVEAGGKGDLNGDGKISTVDVVKLRRLLVGLDQPTDASIKAGDINGDGQLTTADVVKIRRHLVGLEYIGQ